MNFLVRHLCDRPIYHVTIRGEMTKSSEIKGFMWLYEAALPYVEPFLSHVAVPGTKPAQAKASP